MIRNLNSQTSPFSNFINCLEADWGAARAPGESEPLSKDEGFFYT